MPNAKFVREDLLARESGLGLGETAAIRYSGSWGLEEGNVPVCASPRSGRTTSHSTVTEKVEIVRRYLRS